MNRTLARMLALSMVLTGCVAAVKQARSSDKDTSQTLIRGNTVEEVTLALGNPVKREKIEIAQGHFVEFLFYPQINHEGAIEKEELMILAFKDNRLVSWQPSYYQSIKKALQL